MTRKEIEELALRLRKTGLDSSWNDLMILGEELAGNIGDAYKIVSSLSRETGDSSTGDVYISSASLKSLQGKLGKALEVLGGENGFSRFKDESYSW